MTAGLASAMVPWCRPRSGQPPATQKDDHMNSGKDADRNGHMPAGLLACSIEWIYDRLNRAPADSSERLIRV